MLSMPLTIGTNIASSRAQRALSTNTTSLSETFERLSSGKRINRASDDAAGLAVSASLDLKARLFRQGTRNLNDGISLLNVADGALGQLKEITVRQKELAAQAANGVYSDQQRRAIDTEAQALNKEYSRILQSTTYNNISLLNSPTEIVLQGTDSLEGILSIALGTYAVSTVGDGTFGPRSARSTGTYPTGVVATDLNGDGNVDLAINDRHNFSNSVSVRLGNGDGTFGSRSSFLGLSEPSAIAAGDLNGDGIVDLAVTNSGSSSVGVLIGNGNGTYLAPRSFATGTTPEDLELVDLNRDGKLDIVSGGGDSTVSLMLGNGDGTFLARRSYATTGNVMGLTVGDVDGDGAFDVLTADSSSSRISVFKGGGDGTLTSLGSYAAGWQPKDLITFDGNGDGKLDIAFVHGGSTVAVFEGDGAGNFSWNNHGGVSGDNPLEVVAADFNGDGIADLATADAFGPTMSVYIGNGDGTYKARISHASGAWSSGIDVADFNEDGALDIVTADLNASSFSLFLGNTRRVPSASPLDLTTQATARDALDTLEDRLDGLVAEIGQVGMFRSRLEVEIRSLDTMRENMTAASSRITDADVAAESAALLSKQIMQRATVAVLAQANQQPSLTLSLLQV